VSGLFLLEGKRRKTKIKLCEGLWTKVPAPLTIAMKMTKSALLKPPQFLIFQLGTSFAPYFELQAELPNEDSYCSDRFVDF